MSDKRDDERDFHHMIKVAVYALGVTVLTWAFVSFVVRFFE